MVNFVRELSAGEKLYDMEQQLGEKLMYSNLEFEKLKSEAREEMRKNKDYVNQLIHLLKLAIQERDEARNQFLILLNKTFCLPTTPQTLSNVPLFEANSPLLIQGKANSSANDSNSLLDTYNFQPHGSSPVESLFDTISSPEFSSINLVQNSNATLPNAYVDQGSLIIEDLAKGRALPQKGKFLEAVLGAGPLLHTLLMAGPLPRWKNPPQLQPIQVPPVSIKGSDAGVYELKQASNVGQFACGHAQVISGPMTNFAKVNCGNCPSICRLLSPGANTNDYALFGKRQRLC